MKHSALLALAFTLIAATTQADPVSPYKKTGYRDGGVVMRMSEPMGSILNAGEELNFRFQTKQDAFVIVFNIDTEGYVHLLRPSDRLEISSARQNYDIPANGDVLLVDGETGVEFVFALTVPDRSFIDEEELSYLRRMEERPKDERYRIDGDPFLAANMIAGEIVRGISRRDGVYFDYTYFYVNARVDHPCYLCGECEGDVLSMDCETYRIAADFDRETPLHYPLRRAYAMIDPDAAPMESDIDIADAVDDNDGVDVDFYPYRVEVRYISRPWYGYDWYWTDFAWYDPWYSGWYWYPGCYPGASYGYGYGYWNWGRWCGSGWNVGWGWGWGSGAYWRGGWGGYWCSNRYYDPYYGGSVVRSGKYKTRRTDGTLRSGGALATSRQVATTRDRNLRIASRDLRSSPRTSIGRGRTSGIARDATSAFRSRDARATHRTTRISNARQSTPNRGRTYTRRTAASGSNGKVIRGTRRSTQHPPQGVNRSRSGSTRSGSAVRRSTGSSRSRVQSTPARRSSGTKSRATMRSKRSSSRNVKSTPSRSSSSRTKARTSSRSSSRKSSSSSTRSRSSSSSSKKKSRR